MELVRGGNDILLDNDNKKEYVNAKYELTKKS